MTGRTRPFNSLYKSSMSLHYLFQNIKMFLKVKKGEIRNESSGEAFEAGSTNRRRLIRPLLAISSRLFTLENLDRKPVHLWVSTLTTTDPLQLTHLVSVKMHRARPKRSLMMVSLIG